MWASFASQGKRRSRGAGSEHGRGSEGGGPLRGAGRPREPAAAQSRQAVGGPPAKASAANAIQRLELVLAVGTARQVPFERARLVGVERVEHIAGRLVVHQKT